MHSLTERFFLVFFLQALMPYLLNQCGSAAFFLLLRDKEVRIVVPACNALTFFFTALTSLALGEPLEDPCRTIIGVMLILLGTMICCSSE